MFHKIIPSLAILLFALLPSNGFADIFFGNMNTGFGGQLGNGSLEITDNGVDTISFCLDLTGPITNDVIIYIDSVVGGFSDTSGFTDTGDPIRRGISNFSGNEADRTTIGFTGFQPDFAIGADAGFQDLWQLQNGASHTFLGVPDKTGSDYANGVYKLNLDYSLLGIAPGDTINFAVTHTSDTGFLSNELIAGGSTGFDGGNPGFGANTTVSPLTFTVSVPEPGTAGLLFCGLLAAVSLRRKK